MPKIIELLKSKDLAQSSQDALVVFFDEAENLHPCLVQKKDGAYLYATSDLACLQYKQEHYNLNKAIYVTDERQQTHFKQIFKIADMLGWDVDTEHVWFGIMRFKDGIFSSRKGNVIRLEELLDESVKRVRAVIETKNPDLPTAEKELVAEKIGVGAIKYADLSKNPQSMVIFDWDKMLSFEGNTAPYLQYTHARIKSVFRKAAQQQIELEPAQLHLADKLDHGLAIKLSQFPEAVVKAAESCKPNIIADYLFDLGQKFNSYYNQKPFLKAEKEAQNSRLLLAGKTAEILAQGLDLLGIEAVDRM
jgi:arginyl-tRNA synthetase